MPLPGATSAFAVSASSLLFMPSSLLVLRALRSIAQNPEYAIVTDVPDDLRIRPVEPSDGAALAELWLGDARYYAGLDPEAFKIPDEAGLAEWFEQEIRANREHELWFVAELDGDLVGHVDASVEP